MPIRAHRKFFVMEQCPTAMCHATTLLRLNDGATLCAWFGGSAEGADDVGIYLARGSNGRFTPPQLLAASQEPHWNPVLFALDQRTIALYYKVGGLIRQWRTMVRLSQDGGRSFSPEAELVPGDRGGRGPVRCKPIRLHSGAILAPASNEEGAWHAFIDRSEDNGKTWNASGSIYIDCADGQALPSGQAPQERIPVSPQSFEGRGVIQPTLWESQPSCIHAFLRSSEGRIYRADSRDDGRTFTPARAISLPNNNSGIDVVRMTDGALALAHNPVAQNWGPRTPMRLSLSRDNGESFCPLMELDSGEGEFSYPALLAQGHTLYVGYTYQRQNIAYHEIELTGEDCHD